MAVIFLNKPSVSLNGPEKQMIQTSLPTNPFHPSFPLEGTPFHRITVTYQRNPRHV